MSKMNRIIKLIDHVLVRENILPYIANIVFSEWIRHEAKTYYGVLSPKLNAMTSIYSALWLLLTIARLYVIYHNLPDALKGGMDNETSETINE